MASFKIVNIHSYNFFRLLYHFLSWISYRVTSFLVNASREKTKVQKEIQVIRHRLDILREQQSKHLIDLQKLMDNTVHKAVKTLIEHLESDGVRERFSNWPGDEVPKTYDEWKINQILQKKLRDIIDEWEKDHFKNDKDSLVQQIRHSFEFFEAQLRSLRGSVTGGFLSVPGIDPLPESVSFLGRVFVKISWLFHNWFSSYCKPEFLLSMASSWKELEKSYQWYYSDKHDAMKNLSVKYLSEASKESILKPFVKGSLKEAEQYLTKIETLIPEQIEADKRLVEELSGEKRSKEEIKRTYRPILDSALNIREKVAFFGLTEAGAADICSEWLNWNQGSYNRGAGEFPTVHQAKMTRHGEEQAVALKVFQKVCPAKTASRVIQEANQLR